MGDIGLVIIRTGKMTMLAVLLFPANTMTSAFISAAVRANLYSPGQLVASTSAGVPPAVAAVPSRINYIW